MRDDRDIIQLIADARRDGDTERTAYLCGILALQTGFRVGELARLSDTAREFAQLAKQGVEECERYAAHLRFMRAIRLRLKG